MSNTKGERLKETHHAFSVPQNSWDEDSSCSFTIVTLPVELKMLCRQFFKTNHEEIAGVNQNLPMLCELMFGLGPAF